MASKSSGLLALAVALALLSGCTAATEAAKEAGATETVLVTVAAEGNGATYFVELPVEKGASAFEAIKDLVPMTYTAYPQGAFVESIGDVKPREGEYLALYVDGEYSKMGLSGVRLNKDTRIEWLVEAIEEAQVYG